MWSWLTEHFVARITGAEVLGAEERTIRSYAWDVSDLMQRSQDLPRLLIEGMSGRFEEAEIQVREHVGKCYDSRLGYHRFAGAIAHTFILASGQTVDVTPLIGSRCTVKVLLPSGEREVVVGDLSVHHYKWRLRDAGQFYEITPEHVMEVSNRSNAAERASEVVYPQTYSGIGRIYRDERSRGCTGAPGFMVGTVDHGGSPRCPIHEGTLPEDLLR